MSPAQLSGVIEGRGRRGQQHHQVSISTIEHQFLPNRWFVSYLPQSHLLSFTFTVIVAPRLTEAGEEPGGELIRPCQELAGGFQEELVDCHVEKTCLETL